MLKIDMNKHSSVRIYCPVCRDTLYP